MNVLIPCTHCDRYVRSQEVSCPFCKGELAAATAARPVARALLRSPSRAAAFALRTALVVAPATLACGDEDTAARDPDGIASSGGASTTPGTGGGAQNGAGGSPSAGGSAGAIALDQGQEADAGAADAGFVPVPIYGGVFPDPMTRARV